MKKRNAFTIIEVVLVLAIAGLIFLMVFVALPALQRSQRNTQRRQDLSRISSAIIDYSSNNSGDLPFGSDEVGEYFDVDFVPKYLDSSCRSETEYLSNGLSAYPYSCSNDSFCDPSGNEYIIVDMDISVSVGFDFIDADINEIYVSDEARCSSNGFEFLGGSRSKYAIATVLEGGAWYCLDN
ncbi:MAG: type II secretion system protein [Candidatus Saccharibacteria bacterium]|nr:type II secretion system protein [Candidatus Saccharibacteria bacterium]